MLIQRYPVLQPLPRLAARLPGLPLCLLLCLLFGAAGAFAQAGAATARLWPRPVAEGVWMVQGAGALASPRNQGFISNAGFIVTAAGVVVVDALGTPALAQSLLGEIARITPLPVTHVVVTHYHADHIYGLQSLKAAGARVIAHAAAREYLGSDTARHRLAASRQELAPWIDEHTRLVEPDIWLDGPLSIDSGGTRIEIVPVGPAHTPEDVIVRVPSRGVVFVGDLVFDGRVPFVGNADSRAWLRVLDELAAAGHPVVVPGHGAAMGEAAGSALRRTRDYLAHLRRAMGRAARELEPFDEAYAKADWSAYEQWPLFRVAHRMNAYNTYLLMERQGAED